jgi:hypothetical protein
MLYNPLLAHQMAKERMQNILREAERDRLISAAESSTQAQERRLPKALIFGNLLALLARPQS